jgi:2-iminobutanoate/2-iminopropanoate deaminase
MISNRSLLAIRNLPHLLLPVILSCNANDENIRRIVIEEMSKALARTIVSPVETVGPYSPAVRIGGFLFVSGQIGIDQETGELRNESIEAETKQALDNIFTILRSEGYDSSHVVNATVFLKNIEDYQKMNLIYGGYFQETSYPARTTVAISSLPRGANVEITVVAYKPRGGTE